MFEVLTSVKSLITRIKQIHVDNVVFRLHYQLTVFILLAFSILVTSRQYIGDPIDCQLSGKGLRENMIDQYCWVSSTNTLFKALDKKVGETVAHHGVDQYVPGDKVIRHQYYQWVCFVLFLQAIMFYLPHYLWKAWENGRLRALAGDLEGPIIGEGTKKLRLPFIQSYFNNSLNHHTFYVARYSLCELLNFINVVGQMFITNRFLGGVFLTYGTEVISFSTEEQELRTDPMIEVFPRVVKCVFYTYGPSGDVQNHDNLCVLPINIINEKIYIVLWFWFIILAILSGCAVVFRLLTALVPQVRFYLLRARATSVDRDTLETIAFKTQFGDWFLLYLLSKNVNSYVYREVAEEVASMLEIRSGISQPDKQSLYKKYPLENN